MSETEGLEFLIRTGTTTELKGQKWDEMYNFN